MLYKFKSRSTGDLIMLEVNGRQVLEILGKDPDARRASSRPPMRQRPFTCLRPPLPRKKPAARPRSKKRPPAASPSPGLTASRCVSASCR
jgi:hypothetical protein